MNPELNNEESVEVIREQHSVFKVTAVSKYLALALFVLLPFVGGYIGYVYAPEKVVEVVKEVPQQNKAVEEVVVPEQITSLVVEQFMWASKVKIYSDNSVVAMPYINFASTENPVANITLPAEWTISFSEQTSPEESKNIRFTDPDLPGKPDTDAVGAHVTLGFVRADSCEETFIYQNNSGHLTFNEELSSSDIKMYTSNWVTNRTMGSVPSKTVCIENTNDYHDVILMNLYPITDENKTVLDTVVQSIRSE